MTDHDIGDFENLNPIPWDDDLPENTCRFCDSPYHLSFDEGECRHHFA